MTRGAAAAGAGAGTLAAGSALTAGGCLAEADGVKSTVVARVKTALTALTWGDVGIGGVGGGALQFISAWHHVSKAASSSTGSSLPNV